MWDRSLGESKKTPSITVEPTRQFCLSLLTARVEAAFTAQGLHESRGKGSESMSPRLRSARESLLRLLPLCVPRPANGLGEHDLYRFVLNHGDFGMHNMTIAKDDAEEPFITAVFDWEGASIVPAMLAEPKMVITADLVIDNEGHPSIGRWGDGDSPDKMAEYRAWSLEFYHVRLPLARLGIRRRHD